MSDKTKRNVKVGFDLWLDKEAFDYAEARLRALLRELEKQTRFLELLKNHTWNEAVRILKEERKKQEGKLSEQAEH